MSHDLNPCGYPHQHRIAALLLEILYPPVTRVLPHAGKDLLSVRHLLNGTEYGTTKQSGCESWS